MIFEESPPSGYRSDKRKNPHQRRSRFKNRSRLEIVSTILIRAKVGALKTHLMYGANLSFPLVEEYLRILTKAGLLSQEPEVNGKSIIYRTTEKGLNFLTHYEMITSLLGDQSFLMSGAYLASDDTKKPLIGRDLNSPRITIAASFDGTSYQR